MEVMMSYVVSRERNEANVCYGEFIHVNNWILTRRKEATELTRACIVATWMALGMTYAVIRFSMVMTSLNGMTSCNKAVFELPASETQVQETSQN
jgi:hypothetical protein